MIELNAILSLLLLLLLCLFIYGPWQAICTEIARQLMFEKRDALFDMANNNNEDWSFDNREYRIIRSGLEQLIRFAHELTLPSMLFFWVFVRPRTKTERPELSRAIDRIPNRELKQKVSGLIDGALRAAIIMMIAKSPVAVFVLSILAIAIVPGILLSVGMRKCAKAIFGRSKVAVQFEAERVGAIEDAAAA